MNNSLLSRLSIALFASALAVTPVPLRSHNRIAESSDSRDASNRSDIGLCSFLKDNPHDGDKTFTATIGSWRLTLRNTNNFYAGNTTLLEKLKPKTPEADSKKLDAAVHTIAIDSGCPPNVNQNIHQDIKIPRKLFYLINTHAHFDHILGNSQFRDAGAEIIAHINARNEMASLEDFDSSGLPNITFNDEMNLAVDDLVIRLMHLPSGHTNGDIAIWIPKLNILFTGDTYMTEGYPLIDLRTGSIWGLINAVTSMINLTGDNTLIIPGHGNLRTKENGSIDGPRRKDLIQYRDMLIAVTTEVERLKQLGLSLEDIIHIRPTQEYDGVWDNNLICPENFVSFIYNSLAGNQEKIASCSSDNRLDFATPD